MSRASPDCSLPTGSSLRGLIYKRLTLPRWLICKGRPGALGCSFLKILGVRRKGGGEGGACLSAI